MKLRIKISPSSGERDKTFSTEYAGQRYSIGPKAIEVPDEAGRYLVKSFSDIVEIVEEPSLVSAPAVVAPAKRTRRNEPAKKRKPEK